MKENLNIVCMFPYPSGSGLHVGHAYNYSIMDSYVRWKRYKGFTVDFPYGYDSFGLPAEMYAERVGKDVKEVTEDNIDNFRAQLQHLNFSGEEKLCTHTESYQKWTKWLFTKLLEYNLAYKKKSYVNYDPILKTTLANEQVKDGISKRSGAKIEQRELEQWYFKITDYKERLIKNLDTIDYPKSTINAQRQWLENLHDWCVSRQRKWGCPIPIEGETDTLDTFVDSSFYYVRYCDPFNENELCSKENYKQVDLYVGGKEHACMHLIYTRFIHMFLYDIGVVPIEEPFKKVIHQGMITINGSKMSKSSGEVVNPLEYDSDELRAYLMFIGHYFDGGDWDDSKIKGIRKFKGRLVRWFEQEDAPTDLRGSVLQKLEDDLDGYFNSFKFNKVISTLMIFYNNFKHLNLSKNDKIKLEGMLKCIFVSF